ncbi:aspartate ammonia-lyase [Pontiella sulfatireligans]|uniref:Aspartate ammonia-lyase n=1 Tax=Pontiella sulfatireligans TaxID=2750658 RepID=A0A6C2UVQ9_9BACT|nr:lyase family protein [Pontiella sulfatireligans]VGO23274.1 Aspartate ammonia-lyase [Pontiella sulfatireligans]
MNTRTEKDFLGEKQIPADAPWGIHTARALENFPIPGSPVPVLLVSALAQVKKACALANKELGLLSSEKADAIISACEAFQVSGFKFRLSALQGGAGTSTNMMLNELIANKAGNGIHAIEDVNLHQSTNDVYPTAVKVAAIYGLRELAEKVEALQGAFQRLENRFAHIPTIGKTELVDAVPLTLGAEFGAFAEAFARDRWRTFKCEERLRVVNLGGTAVGTGLTAPRSYIFLVTDKLREVTGLGLSRGENLVDQTANADAFVEVSGIMKACASNLLKICNDLRLLHMIKKIKLPAVQAGSSIMPGKVNPVILESVMQIGIKVQANDFIVTECASRGSLQINEFMPLLASALLESMELLGAASEMLAKHAEGITADEGECERQFNSSVEIVTAFLPVIGYDRATELVEKFKQANRTDFKTYLIEELGEESVLKILSPQNLMAMGHRET